MNEGQCYLKEKNDDPNDETTTTEQNEVTTTESNGSWSPKMCYSLLILLLSTFLIWIKKQWHWNAMWLIYVTVKCKQDKLITAL